MKDAAILEDNIVSGSSFQYSDWSKPSKDGWRAVRNPVEVSFDKGAFTKHVERMLKKIKMWPKMVKMWSKILQI